MMRQQRKVYRNKGTPLSRIGSVKPKTILRKPAKSVLENISCRIGNNACAVKHTSSIQRSGLLSPMSESMRNSSLLRLQRQYGNRFVQRVLGRREVQAKLMLGKANDEYEQEADRVADQVMKMPEPQVQRQVEDEEEEELIQTKPLVEQITPLVQKQLVEEEELQAKENSYQISCITGDERLRGQPEEEEELIQVKETANRTPEVTQNLEYRINTIRVAGKPLNASTRAFFEPRFRYDFSQVRIHTDSEASGLSNSLNAQAFTTGQDVFFRQGTYNPDSSSGRHLLAHELTHVVQQSILKPLTVEPAIQQKPKKSITKVGPVSGQGGLRQDVRKRLSAIIGPDDTLRSMARKLLSIWTTATPFTPEGASAPLPLTPLTEEQLAKGLLVYNRYYLAVPHMTNWKVGLRFPLPIEVNQVTGERTINPDLILTWANSFDPGWVPLLDQKPAATSAPNSAELVESVKSFLQTAPTPMVQGIHLSAKAMTNAQEAEPFIKEVFRQLGSDAFNTALAFMNELVIHQFELLASQRPGLEIIDAVRSALATAPTNLTGEQQTNLARANRMLSELGMFSKETAETFKQIYIKDVPGCNCMTAVYKGLEGLLSQEISGSIRGQVVRDAREVMKRTGRDTNHMDRIMETARARGKAGPMTELKYDNKAKKWEPDPETTVLNNTHPTVAGWYFFGLSLHGAYHSLILAVDKTDINNPQIYWMDQFSSGFTNNVTGKLSEEMKDWKPSYGFAPSKIWQIVPAADTLIELH